MKPKVAVFRFDASPAIGMGHMQRCLALAAELTGMGVESHFVCRLEAMAPAASGVWVDAGQGSDDAVFLGEYAAMVGASAMVLDHYGIDQNYQQALLPAGIPWLQFEGRPRGALWAKWVLAASPAADAADYQPLLQRRDARLLLGPRYAILRSEFLGIPPATQIRPEVRDIAVTLGGGWDRGGIMICLEALGRLESGVRVHVLTTSANPSIAELNQRVTGQGDGRTFLHVDARDFVRRISRADLAIIAGGTTTFETAYLGVPALIIQIADNQKANSGAWARMGVADDLGTLEALDAEKVCFAVEKLCREYNRRQKMSELGRAMVDGCGVKYVAEALMEEMG